jgi:hypothetical protein
MPVALGSTLWTQDRALAEVVGRGKTPVGVEGSADRPFDRRRVESRDTARCVRHLTGRPHGWADGPKLDLLLAACGSTTWSSRLPGAR